MEKEFNRNSPKRFKDVQRNEHCTAIIISLMCVVTFLAVILSFQLQNRSVTMDEKYQNVTDAISEVINTLQSLSIESQTEITNISSTISKLEPILHNRQKSMDQIQDDDVEGKTNAKHSVESINSELGKYYKLIEYWNKLLDVYIKCREELQKL